MCEACDIIAGSRIRIESYVADGQMYGPKQIFWCHNYLPAAVNCYLSRSISPSVRIQSTWSDCMWSSARNTFGSFDCFAAEISASVILCSSVDVYVYAP